MPDRCSTAHSPKSCRPSKSTSYGAPIGRRASSCSPSAGSSNAASLGSTVAAGSPKTGKISTATPSPSSNSLPSASCYENYAIPAKVSGRTLRTDRPIAQGFDNGVVFGTMSLQCFEPMSGFLCRIFTPGTNKQPFFDSSYVPPQLSAGLHVIRNHIVDCHRAHRPRFLLRIRRERESIAIEPGTPPLPCRSGHYRI